MTMTTISPGERSGDDLGYDDLTPHLMELARRMDVESPRPVVALVPVEQPRAGTVVVPTVATRIPAPMAVMRSRNRADRRVRFTLAFSGSVDPLSIGVLVLAIGILTTMVIG